MPGIAALGKLFFEKIRGKEKRLGPQYSGAACARRLLVVGEVIRRKSRRGRKHFIAVNENAAVAPRREFAIVRVRRDNPGAAGGQTINQPSIGCNSKHSDAH